YVVIWIVRIPVERLFHRPGRYLGGDDIRHVGSLLGVDGESVVDWRVGSDDDCVGRNPKAAGGDLRRVPAFDGVDVRIGEDAPSGARHRLGQPAEILHRVKLRLAWESYAGNAASPCRRHARQQLGREPGALCRRGLLLQQHRVVAWREEQIAIDALELAVNPFPGHDRLDLIDRSAVTLGYTARAVLAVQP